MNPYLHPDLAAAQVAAFLDVLIDSLKAANERIILPQSGVHATVVWKVATAGGTQFITRIVCLETGRPAVHFTLAHLVLTMSV